MQGTIIENLSGRKLSVLVILLVIAQIICFLIGGLIGKLRNVNHFKIIIILILVKYYIFYFKCFMKYKIFCK